MEHTFFKPPAPIERRGEKDNTRAAAAGENVQSAEDRTAEVRTIAFQPREMVALSQLEISPESNAASSSFKLRVGETPAEFMHVFSGLERIVSRVGDVSMITGNLLETGRPYVLGVTSAVGGEGKTTTALHLAMTIARSTPKRVCLIDLGLGDSVLASRLGMPATDDGLVAAVEDDIDVVACFNLTGLDNLVVVPAGRAPASPAKFVRMPRIAQFLIATRHAFDIVIVDMPAVATEHAAPLARHTDSVVMVVRSGITPREVVTEAMGFLGSDRVSCVILNREKPAAPSWLQKRYGRG